MVNSSNLKNASYAERETRSECDHQILCYFHEERHQGPNQYGVDHCQKVSLVLVTLKRERVTGYERPCNGSTIKLINFNKPKQHINCHKLYA